MTGRIGLLCRRRLLVDMNDLRSLKDPLLEVVCELALPSSDIPWNSGEGLLGGVWMS